MKYFFNNKIYFDELDISNVTKEYVSWLNDKEVIKYSQVQYKKISINSQKKYLNKVKNDQSSKIFGIFFESEHIGNILIKNINQINKNAEIIEHAVKKGIIEKAGAWYSYKGDKIGQGIAKTSDFLKENPKILDEIESLVLED